jgi:hypothetical protein
MKKYILKFMIPLLVFTGVVFSCDKNNNLDMSNLENLYAQSLSVIQNVCRENGK